MDNVTSFWSDAGQTEQGEPIERRSESLYETWYPWLAGTIAFSAFSGVPGNLMTIVAYRKYNFVRTPTGTLIVNQSIGDLFTCLTSPLFIFLHYTVTGQQLSSSYRYFCLVGLFPSLLSVQLSVTSLLALSVERFVAVFYSLEYYNWVTDCSVRVGITVMWSVAVLLNSIPLLGFNQWREGAICRPARVYSERMFQLTFILPCFICLLSVAALNILIAVAVCIKRRATVPITIAAVENHAHQERSRSSGGQKTDFPVSKMLLMVVGAFYACWIPYLSIYGLILNPPAAWRIKGVPKVVRVLSELSKSMVGFNANVNPFIYAFKNPAFKRAFRKLLKNKVWKPK